MSATFGITPSDDDKLFPVETLDLERRAPVRVIPWRVDRHRYDRLGRLPEEKAAFNAIDQEVDKANALEGAYEEAAMCIKSGG
jgi:hypothetical protein